MCCLGVVCVCVRMCVCEQRPEVPKPESQERILLVTTRNTPQPLQRPGGRLEVSESHLQVCAAAAAAASFSESIEHVGVPVCVRFKVCSYKAVPSPSRWFVLGLDGYRRQSPRGRPLHASWKGAVIPGRAQQFAGPVHEGRVYYPIRI